MLKPFWALSKLDFHSFQVESDVEIVGKSRHTDLSRPWLVALLAANNLYIVFNSSTLTLSCTRKA